LAGFFVFAFVREEGLAVCLPILSITFPYRSLLLLFPFFIQIGFGFLGRIFFRISTPNAGATFVALLTQRRTQLGHAFRLDFLLHVVPLPFVPFPNGGGFGFEVVIIVRVDVHHQIVQLRFFP